MPFVVDASVAAGWAFDDEQYPSAAAALDRLQVEEAVAPTLWWFEVRNTLLVNERRGRITLAGTVEFLSSLSQLPIQLDPAPVEASVLELARRHRLTVYDAAYLEVAIRLGAPLATLDRALMAAADAAGVELIR